MKLSDLIRRFRVLAKDEKKPYFWGESSVTDWLADAERQAVVRGRLLLEAADPAMCQIAVVPDQHTYPLHAKVYELVNVRFREAGASRSTTLKVVSRGWLDAKVRDWRDESGDVRYIVQGERSAQLVGVPDRAGVLLIEAQRLPLKTLAALDDEPEIHEASHEHLIDWALHKAFSVPDAQSFDPDRSRLAEQAFAAYFGLLPDADMRRVTREDTDQTNEVHL